MANNKVNPNEFSVVPAIAHALITFLEENPDAGWQMVCDTCPEDVLVPGRYEDLDHFSAQVTESVLSDPEVQDAIHAHAMRLFRNLMRPV